MVRNYVSEDQNDLSKHILLTLYAYCTSINDTIGISPAEALQVRKLRLRIVIIRPASLRFGGENRSKSFDEMVNKMKVIRTNAEIALEAR